MNPRRPARNAKIRPPELLDERIVPSNASFVEAKGGATLGSIYRQYLAYEKAGGTGTFRPAEASKIDFKGTSVALDLRYGSGDFDTLIGQLKGIGMKVSATAPRYKLVEGYLPISELPTVLANSHQVGILPVYKPSFKMVKPPTPTLSTSITEGATSSKSPLTKASGALGIIAKEYAAYVNAGSQGTFVSSQSRVSIQGNMVGVDIRVVDGSLDKVAGQLKGIGMKVLAVNSTYKIVEGALPISRLAMVNNNSNVVAILAVYRPTLG